MTTSNKHHRLENGTENGAVQEDDSSSEHDPPEAKQESDEEAPITISWHEGRASAQQQVKRERAAAQR